MTVVMIDRTVARCQAIRGSESRESCPWGGGAPWPVLGEDSSLQVAFSDNVGNGPGYPFKFLLIFNF